MLEVEFGPPHHKGGLFPDSTAHLVDGAKKVNLNPTFWGSYIDTKGPVGKRCSEDE